MKRIFILISTITLVFTSCSKSLSKVEVEKKFLPVVAEQIPTAAIGNITLAENKLSISIEAYFEGDFDNIDSLKLGVQYGADATFVTSGYEEVSYTDLENGNYVFNVSSTSGETNYVRVFAESIHGASYSEVKSLDVPPLPWYFQVSDKYYAKLISYWEDAEYDSTITFDWDMENKTVVVKNINAYFVYKGASYEKSEGQYNYVNGTIDLENRTVTCEMGNAPIIASHTPYPSIAFDYNEDGSDITNISEFVLIFSENGKSFRRPGVGTFSGSGYYEIEMPATYEAVK